MRTHAPSLQNNPKTVSLYVVCLTKCVSGSGCDVCLWCVFTLASDWSDWGQVYLTLMVYLSSYSHGDAVGVKKTK